MTPTASATLSALQCAVSALRSEIGIVAFYSQEENLKLKRYKVTRALLAMGESFDRL